MKRSAGGSGHTPLEPAGAHENPRSVHWKTPVIEHSPAEWLARSEDNQSFLMASRPELNHLALAIHVRGVSRQHDEFSRRNITHNEISLFVRGETPSFRGYDIT